MLGQRIITALLMVAVLLPILFHSDPSALAGLSVLLMALAGWEWGRLNGLAFRPAVAIGLSCFLACLITWWWMPVNLDGSFMGYGVPLIWIGGGYWMLRHGLARWNALPLWFRCLVGVLVLWVTWLALFDAKKIGTNFTLSVLLLVWVADIAAYFAGRAFGRHKLAPTISPGKSWEGVVGALIGVVALSQLWLMLDATWLMNLTILGSTGSVGTSTLNVVARHPERFKVWALTAARQVDLMFEQCQQFRPERVVMVQSAAAAELRQRLSQAGLSAIGVMDGWAALDEPGTLSDWLR